MEFNLMQFNAYTKLLQELLKESNADKKEELVKKLELIRSGFLPVNFKYVED
ncbi:hypothetical protein ABFP60_02315 [Clostridioides difficile]